MSPKRKPAGAGFVSVAAAAVGWLREAESQVAHHRPCLFCNGSEVEFVALRRQLVKVLPLEVHHWPAPAHVGAVRLDGEVGEVLLHLVARHGVSRLRCCLCAHYA